MRDGLTHGRRTHTWVNTAVCTCGILRREMHVCTSVTTPQTSPQAANPCGTRVSTRQTLHSSPHVVVDVCVTNDMQLVSKPSKKQQQEGPHQRLRSVSLPLSRFGSNVLTSSRPNTAEAGVDVQSSWSSKEASCRKAAQTSRKGHTARRQNTDTQPPPSKQTQCLPCEGGNGTTPSACTAA